MTKFYKVVTPCTDGFYSASAWNLPRQYRVKYEIGKWAEAPIGGLLVYDSFALAKDWCEDEVPIPPRRSVYCFEDEIKAVWDGSSAFPGFWPPGSHAFKRVMLIEEVI